MDKIAISVQGLSKTYTLNRGCVSRLWQLFGFSSQDQVHSEEEFWALRDVTVEIVEGSTVGLIGRNGAGKSTFLRLLAGASAPTCGAIRLSGVVSSLLELGTGLHPDLTGHDNIFVCGLYLGMDRDKVQAMYEDVVSFAELGDFLHRPVRTYSTGMQMRLAFSIATAVTADIQIIDEVLGVGDAYFFGKCLQRFSKLQSEGRTTVLASHDHSAILRLCSRCLWIEEGRVVADGTPLEVITQYTQATHQRFQLETRKADPPVDESHRLGADDIEIAQVEYLNMLGEQISSCRPDDTLVVRIHYHARKALHNATMWVGIYRTDGVLACSVISSLDNVRLMLEQGLGMVDLILKQVLLGPGEYTVVVGIYPHLDLDDANGTQLAVLWHQENRMVIRPLDGVALDLGMVRHPVEWRLSCRTEVGITVVENSR